MNTSGGERICETCGTGFHVAPYVIRRGWGGRFCSRTCAGVGHRTHGQTVGGASPEYRAWVGLKKRVHGRSGRWFAHYGGRGITVCPEWDASFEAFLRDMGPRPSSHHSLDRIDNDGNYEPGNVRWATWTQQARNRRGNIWLTANGSTRVLSEWSEITGIHIATLWDRLRVGWSPERTVTEPPEQRGIPISAEERARRKERKRVYDANRRREPGGLERERLQKNQWRARKRLEVRS